MFNMRNTVKSFLKPELHASCIAYSNAEVFNIERREKGASIFVATLTIEPGDAFTFRAFHELHVGQITAEHTGIGIVDYIKTLDACNMLHPDEKVDREA